MQLSISLALLIRLVMIQTQSIITLLIMIMPVEVAIRSVSTHKSPYRPMSVNHCEIYIARPMVPHGLLGPTG